MQNEKDLKASWLVSGAGAAMALSGAPAFADAGGYVGVGVGQATIEVDGGDVDGGEGFIVNVPDFDENDTGYKIYGGWMFNDNIGVELAYIDFGSMDDNFGTNGAESLEVEADGIVLSLLGSIPLGPVDLFAKLGMLSYDADLTLNLPPLGSASAGTDGEEFAWGVGAAVNIGESFSIRAEYEGFEFDDVDEVSLISVSAQINF